MKVEAIRDAVHRQHEAALLMLRQAVDICPPDLWLSGEHPRTVWRIAYHAAAYTHLYLFPDLASFERWEKGNDDCAVLEGEVAEVEPYTIAEMVEYIDQIRSQVGSRLAALDLESPTSGFTWYPQVTKIELMMLSLRHLHGHIGQIHELLIARGLDVEWLGPPPAKVLT